jgi:hypothetical protein
MLLKSYIVESSEGPIEVADLFFEDGTATRLIRWDHIAFVE